MGAWCLRSGEELRGSRRNSIDPECGAVGDRRGGVLGKSATSSGFHVSRVLLNAGTWRLWSSAPKPTGKGRKSTARFCDVLIIRGAAEAAVGLGISPFLQRGTGEVMNSMRADIAQTLMPTSGPYSKICGLCRLRHCLSPSMDFWTEISNKIVNTWCADGEGIVVCGGARSGREFLDTTR